MQVEERALFELNQLGSVSCAPFREDVENGHLTPLILKLSLFNCAHGNRLLLTSGTPVQKLALDALGDLSDSRDFLHCFFSHE